MSNLKEEMSKMRREFHQIAEPGWLEFQTTVRLMNYLKSYGYELEYGKKIHSERMGLPSDKTMKDYASSLTLAADFDTKEILEGYYWEEEEIIGNQEKAMVNAFNDIWEIKEEHKVTMRKAAYLHSVDKGAKIMKLRGWY